MTEGVSSALSPEDAAAARASEQARLRKERREAKIKAGGSARLNKITGLGGGLPRDPPPQPTAPEPSKDAAPTSKAQESAARTEKPEHADPEEVDISEHHYTPKVTPRPATASSTTPPDPSAMSEAQLRRLMLGFDPSGGSGGPGDAPSAGPPGGADDPMMKLLSQMMGGQGFPGGPGGGGPGSSNPFAAAGFPGMTGGGGGPQVQMQQQQAAAPPVDTYAVVWRVLHLVVALGLGLYIAIFSSFTGTKEARDRAALASSEGYPDLDGDAERRHLFFWAFATAEAVLLTSRFFLDRARAPPSGILWTIAGFLPPPAKSYAEAVLRYGQIFSTVRSDLLVCVFILGVASWLRAM